MSHFIREQCFDAVQQDVYIAATRKEVVSQLYLTDAEPMSITWPDSLDVGKIFKITWCQFRLTHVANYQITSFQPTKSIEIKQIRGLFKTWLLKISVEPVVNNTSILTVLVNYELPFGILGSFLSDVWLRQRIKEGAQAYISAVERVISSGVAATPEHVFLGASVDGSPI